MMSIHPTILIDCLNMTQSCAALVSCTSFRLKIAILHDLCAAPNLLWLHNLCGWNNSSDGSIVKLYTEFLQLFCCSFRTLKACSSDVKRLFINCSNKQIYSLYNLHSCSWFSLRPWLYRFECGKASCYNMPIRTAFAFIQISFDYLCMST